MIKLMIADDHQIFLDGLKSLLQTEAGIDVVGQALNGRQLLGQIPHLQPDVILLDINMPEMDGLEAAAQLRVQYPAIQVIMLTMHERADFITKLMQAGVAGYLLKNSSRHDLVEAIRIVHGGGSYFSRQVTQAVMDNLRKSSKVATPGEGVELTPRETDVLRLIAQEYTTAEIAEKLFISTHTVESHRKNLLSKLGKKNTAGLAAYAVQQGVV